MDIEKSFLSKVALTGQIESVMAEGINGTHFENDAHQDIFNYIADHTQQYHAPPSLEVLTDKFPGYNFESPPDSLAYLRDQFVKEVKTKFAMQSLYDLANLITTGGPGAENIDGLLLAEAQRLSQLLPTNKMHKFSEMDSRIANYGTESQLSRGIRMGIPAFDRLTQGIQPHEYITICGWQGTGKSTLTQWILFNAWMQDKTSMIISLEMEGPALMRKWDTMLTNFEYLSLKSGTLTLHDLERWKQKAALVREKKCDILVRDDIRSCTPDFVYAEAMRYKPDIIAVDYISLMDTSRTGGSQMWEKITYLTQAMKQIARSTGIPIIGVAQTNKDSSEGGAKLDNISYSRSIGQDSDIVLGLHQDDEMKENKRMTVRMLKNRDGAKCDDDLLWDMDHMRFRPWNESDVFKNKMFDRESGEIFE